MKKNLFFDIGNVLIYFDNQKMFSRFRKECSLESESLQKTFSDTDLLHEFERGLLDNETFFSEFSKLMQIEMQYPAFVDIITDIFKPNTEIEPLIQKLKAQGYPLFLLSNTNDLHFNHVYKKYPILSLFDQHVLSHEIGARKPDPEIYEHAIALAKSEPSNCFFTDDLPENIEAARNMGIDAELFTDTKNLEKQLADRGIG